MANWNQFKDPGFLERSANLEPTPREPKPSQIRDVPACEAFTREYSKFHRVWSEILRDGLQVVIEAQTRAEVLEARNVAAALIEAFEVARKKYCPEALLKAVEA